jgi:hypothetical protein
MFFSLPFNKTDNIENPKPTIIFQIAKLSDTIMFEHKNEEKIWSIQYDNTYTCTNQWASLTRSFLLQATCYYQNCACSRKYSKRKHHIYFIRKIRHELICILHKLIWKSDTFAYHWFHTQQLQRILIYRKEPAIFWRNDFFSLYCLGWLALRLSANQIIATETLSQSDYCHWDYQPIRFLSSTLFHHVHWP